MHFSRTLKVIHVIILYFYIGAHYFQADIFLDVELLLTTRVSNKDGLPRTDGQLRQQVGQLRWEIKGLALG